MDKPLRRIRVGHSPDADDAFMFYALAKNRIDTDGYLFEHELVDIETLNRRAFAAELELTAVSVHAYAYLSDKYLLCSCGASMGEGYGPIVVARKDNKIFAGNEGLKSRHSSPHPNPLPKGEGTYCSNSLPKGEGTYGMESNCLIENLKQAAIAVPGELTTAYLVLRLCLGDDFPHVVVPFDRIPDAVLAGEYEGRRVDAGLLIHEGQLTYGEQGLKLILDTGRWWSERAGLPLPLGANAIRKDLGKETIRDVHRLLKKSIEYGLEHREEALDYALGFGRGLQRDKADRFVDMYVNKWTLDFGPVGRAAVAGLLKMGYQSGALPKLIEPEFAEN
jgi:1,4-dihydroxy-6-naphthoate synthase